MGAGDRVMAGWHPEHIVLECGRRGKMIDENDPEGAFEYEFWNKMAPAQGRAEAI
jgi:hypothetical protein